MTTTHTSHPCASEGCTSSHRWVLVDPEHEGSLGYDAIRASVTDYRLLVGVVSRTFGADTFDSEAEALEHRDAMLAAGAAALEPPVGVAYLERAVPMPWGSRHATSR